MKRSSESLGLEPPPRTANRRQEPVSCQFCRSKKLKCDRGSPCSNCRARQLRCSSSNDHQGLSVAATASSEDPAQSSLQIDELNSRVRKLEQLLAARSTPDQGVSNLNSASVSSNIRKETSTDVELAKTVTWLETDAFEHEPSEVDGTSASRAKIAEGFGSFIFSLTRPRVPPSLNLHNVELLPMRSQGEPLLEFFFDKILWIYHIVHVPTVRRQFDGLYTSIEHGQQPDYGHLALISTIYALAAYFSSPSSGLFFKHTEAMAYCHRWTLLAQDALSAANCLACPTIETLQSLIFIAQQLMPNIGAIATLRTLLGTAAHAARALGLHKVDSPSNKKRRENIQVDWAALEVKRRIWWHIASTDWIMSFMSGSQCGTYTIQPKHMNVDYPSNIDDSEINPRGDYALPVLEPTEMTLFLYRINSSVIFREIADAAWDAGIEIEELPYELILEFDKRLGHLMIEFDKKFQKLSMNYPGYFDYRNQTQDGVVDKKTKILAWQRNLAHFGVNTRFARLHRPFLVRGAQDPRYAYSRMCCLRSARKVIEIGTNMIASGEGVDSIKIWAVNHHIFVSTIILVMDYCFNREEPQAKERKEEILECFRILESSNEESTMATRGLQKLRNILRDGATGRRGEPGSTVGQLEAAQTDVFKYASGSQQSAPPSDSLHPASASITQMQDPNVLLAEDGFNQPSSQSQWPEFDFASLENIDFGADLDASQFDILFQNIEGSNKFY